MKKWSSQWMQFMQLRKEAWKKFRTSTGFKPVTSRLPVRCSTNWAMKPLTLGAGQLWVHMFPWKKWVLMIYEINRIWTAEMKWKWRNDRRSERNLCNCVKKPEKIQDFNGVWTRDLAIYRCDTLPTELWSHWRWEQYCHVPSMLNKRFCRYLPISRCLQARDKKILTCARYD